MSGGQYRVESYAAEPTPHNAINEKAIVDAEAVGEAIRRAVKRSGAKSRLAAIAISGDAAITKVIQMPKNLGENELEGQVEMQADQYIPFPMEEVSYDYQVVGPSEKDPEMLDVLLVATRTENIEQRQAAVQASGLTAQIVDVEAFALENACALMRHQMPDGGLDRTIAVVDFGASSTTFSVLRDMKVIYTRDFAFGGQQLTEEIMRTYGLSMEEAGRAKKEGGLPSNYQPEVLDPFIDDMTQQVSRSLQFYLASGSGRSQPDQILVCGGCANIPGVADVISSRVGVPADRGDPLGNMKISSKAKAQAVSLDATALLTAWRCVVSTEGYMPRINLLPWRESERKTRRREFAIAAGGAVIAAVMFALAGKLMYSSWIDAQTEKNNLLKKEIVKLEAQITDILDLENRKQRLIARMEIIEKLQRSRPEIVHLFDELVKTVPEGVYLTSIKQTGRKLEIHGIAQSSTRVSSFMRNIDASTWMANPVLQVVEAAKDAPTGGSSFTLFTDTVGVDLDGGGDSTSKKVASK